VCVVYKVYNLSHRENKHADNHTTKQKQKWVTFTYTGKETKFITQIFKNTDIQIAYKTRNLIKTLLTTKHHKQDRYSASGVYKLTCLDCKKAYVGQTGRSFTQRFKKHLLSFRTNNNASNFAQHLLDDSHTFGPINETMDILHFQQKGIHMNTLEKYCIYKEVINNNHLNKQYVTTNNHIFNTVYKYKRT
jgi:hypothetical protein